MCRRSQILIRWQHSVWAIGLTMTERASRDQQRRFPALRALERYPLAAIAVANDGAVLFANATFAELLGCSCDAVTAMSHEFVRSTLPVGETLFAVARVCPNALGRSLQSGQATCLVKVRKSAVLDGAESVAVEMFAELEERLSGRHGTTAHAACADAGSARHPVERLLTCGAQQCLATPRATRPTEVGSALRPR